MFASRYFSVPEPQVLYQTGNPVEDTHVCSHVERPCASWVFFCCHKTLSNLFSDIKEEVRFSISLPLQGQGEKMGDSFQQAMLVALMVSGGGFSLKQKSGQQRNASFHPSSMHTIDTKLQPCQVTEGKKNCKKQVSAIFHFLKHFYTFNSLFF